MPINSFEEGDGFGDGGIYPRTFAETPGGYRRKREIEGFVAPAFPRPPIDQWEGGPHLVTSDDVAKAQPSEHLQSTPKLT